MGCECVDCLRLLVVNLEYYWDEVRSGRKNLLGVSEACQIA